MISDRYHELARDIAVSVGIVGLLLVIGHAAHARGDGYADTTTEARQWFQSLMQPDNLETSCCGEADAYEADDFEVKGDRYVAIITDTRPDTLRNGHIRPHVPVGTRITIPNAKLKYDAGNPTGHGYVFLGDGDKIYCYVTPAGG